MNRASAARPLRAVAFAAIAALAGGGLAAHASADPAQPAAGRPAAPPLPAPDAVTAANARVEALAQSGDECAVLVGLPSASQRSRASAIAIEAIARLQRAEMELTARIAALRATNPTAAAELQAAELGLRVPLLRARAAVIAGVAERNAATLTGAIEQLGALDPMAVAPAALRRYLLAVALYHRDVINGGLPGSPSPEVSQAIDLLRSVSDWPIGPDANTQHPPALAAEVRFAMIRVGTHARGDGAIALRAGEWEDQPPFIVRDGGSENEMAEPGLFVRHAEARAAALAALWVARPGKITFEQLIEPIGQSVRASRMAVPANAKNRDVLAQQRAAAIRESLIGRTVGSILEAGGSQLELPPWAVVAGAAELARDPGTREVASIILEALLRRKDLGDATPDALFFSAMTLAESERARDLVEGVKRASRAVDAGLREPRRAVLLANLPAVAAQAVRRAEAVSPRDERLVSEANDARIAALRSAGRSVPTGGPAPGAGAVELAKAILRKPGMVEVEIDGKAQKVNRINPATLSDALEVLRPSKEPEARQLADAAIDAAIAYGRALVVNSTNPTADGQALVRTAETALAWTGENDRSRAALLRVALADGYAAAGDARATAIYEQLLATEPPPMSPMVLVIRKARAQRAAGDPAAAFATLRNLVDLLEGAPQRPPEFFTAWADMLEILAADNGSGRRADQIRLRVAHLRSLDKTLGTPEAAERIDMVERSLR
ncbi:MAG TPA: hypothetical protein VEB22_04150 [Phycisphaerales bacterium]|nr:hypothetical protein [Phycisphaerales bacterium]